MSQCIARKKVIDSTVKDWRATIEMEPHVYDVGDYRAATMADAADMHRASHLQRFGRVHPVVLVVPIERRVPV